MIYKLEQELSDGQELLTLLGGCGTKNNAASRVEN